ncbi:hypothetical protein MLD38_009965 [Melastoma candidum]|uniref:Uncharacterized protein n=1 Tax=Melastoma candidum TaxID=119954 RepID=A0ACB9QY80_9MYRT|nr:hypothetical protein MLD38_009965 [Melastoma candidum]
MSPGYSPIKGIHISAVSSLLLPHSIRGAPLRIKAVIIIDRSPLESWLNLIKVVGVLHLFDELLQACSFVYSEVASVVLPLSDKDIPTASGLQICFIIVAGWLASLCVAGYSAISVRKLVRTELVDAEPMGKPSPFSALELWAWSGVFVISFVAALYYQTALGTNARTCLPFLLASTVLSYIIGSGLPAGMKKVFHPIICYALAADVAAFTFGFISHSGLDPLLGHYLTKASSDPGAGDVLMGFWGSVILSFAFSMFKQRKLVRRRHAAEMFTSVIIATILSLLYRFSRASCETGTGPYCVCSAPVHYRGFGPEHHANSSLIAAVVVVTGLVRANFVQAVLDKLDFRDPIARGAAKASRAHGLGTAALSAKEPEAPPFCAYALTTIFGSLICSIPVVRDSAIFG